MATIPDRAPFEPRESHHEILRKVLVNFEEFALVHDFVNRILDVVRFLRIFRHQRVQRRRSAIPRIVRRAPRRIFKIIRRQVAEQLANHREALGIVARNEMRDAALLVVRHRAAELLLRHFFVRHRLDHVRPGDEHVRAVARHENKIRDRWRIHRAARARAHDRADLRHHAARQRVAQKNICVTRERHHAFLNPRAARIVQPNHRRALPHRQIHNLRNLRSIRLRKRPAKHGEVLRENINEAAIDAAVAGDEAVARRTLLLHPEIGAMVPHKFVELLEGAFIEQQVHPLPRAELAFFVLAFAAFSAAAFFGFGVAAAKLFEAVEMFAVFDWFWGAHNRLPISAFCAAKASEARFLRYPFYRLLEKAIKLFLNRLAGVLIAEPWIKTDVPGGQFARGKARAEQ